MSMFKKVSLLLAINLVIATSAVLAMQENSRYSLRPSITNVGWTEIIKNDNGTVVRSVYQTQVNGQRRWKMASKKLLGINSVFHQLLENQYQEQQEQPEQSIQDDLDFNDPGFNFDDFNNDPNMDVIDPLNNQQVLELDLASDALITFEANNGQQVQLKRVIARHAGAIDKIIREKGTSTFSVPCDGSILQVACECLDLIELADKNGLNFVELFQNFKGLTEQQLDELYKVAQYLEIKPLCAVFGKEFGYDNQQEQTIDDFIETVVGSVSLETPNNTACAYGQQPQQGNQNQVGQWTASLDFQAIFAELKRMNANLIDIKEDTKELKEESKKRKRQEEDQEENQIEASNKRTKFETATPYIAVAGLTVGVVAFAIALYCYYHQITVVDVQLLIQQNNIGLMKEIAELMTATIGQKIKEFTPEIVSQAVNLAVTQSSNLIDAFRERLVKTPPEILPTLMNHIHGWRDYLSNFGQ